MNYTHAELNKEIQALSGYYTLQREERLPYNKREVFYVVGWVDVDGACCGSASFGYVLVPGYIVNWHKSRNENGLPVSEVEPVTDSAAIKELTEIIRQKEKLPQVDFW